MAKNEKNEIMPRGVDLSSDDLAAIASFDDALSLLVSKMGEGEVRLASEVLGDGFRGLDDKDQLIGVPLLLVTWDFSMGDFGEFVVARIVTQDNRKFIITDGSTGIRDQLMQYSAKFNKRSGLLVQKGLRRSDYVYQDDKGQERPAKTYYLDVSA